MLHLRERVRAVRSVRREREDRDPDDLHHLRGHRQSAPLSAGPAKSAGWMRAHNRALRLEAGMAEKRFTHLLMR